MTEWQPIETAPKDGTVFLAYWHDMPAFVAWIDGIPDRVITRRTGIWPFSKVEQTTRAESGWRVLMALRSGGFGVHGNYAPFNPRAWQPLPDPPQ